MTAFAHYPSLTDRTVLTDAEDSQFSGSYRYTFAAPRTFGVKLWTYS